MISVVQPPPAAYCGRIAGEFAPAESGAIGSVVIRNSERSLVSPRRATAPIGDDDSNVNVPWIEDAPNTTPEFVLVNGASLRNFAICWRAGSVNVPAPKSLPLTSVK